MPSTALTSTTRPERLPPPTGSASTSRSSAKESVQLAVEGLAMALLVHRELDGNAIVWLVTQLLRGRNYADLAVELSHRVGKSPGESTSRRKVRSQRSKRRNLARLGGR